MKLLCVLTLLSGTLYGTAILPPTDTLYTLDAATFADRLHAAGYAVQTTAYDPALSECAGNCPSGYQETTFSFDTPIYGFGADIDFNGQILGSLIFGNWPLETQPDDGLHSYTFSGDGFFGITATDPFNTIIIRTDYENGYDYQPYTIRDIEAGISDPAPEPASLYIFTVGLLVLSVKALGPKNKTKI